MTLYIHYELSCDDPDCFDAYQSNITEVNSRTRTLAGAKRSGWTHRTGKDFCPKHASAEPEGTPDADA